jgi:predicted dehydrogenase
MATSQKQEKKFRFAFIGAGGISNAYLAALAKMPEVEVVALSDVVEVPMREKAEKHGIPANHCFTDYKKMLKQVQPDAVAVVTPNGQHAPNTIAALKAGSHVIVEKPMGMNAKECQQMIAAAKQAKKKLVIGFQYRYDPKTQFIKTYADAGLLGDIRFGRVWALRRRGIPNWGVFGQKHLQGGGPMIDIGVHALEMCHYAMGSPKPVAATGLAETYMGNLEAASTKVISRWANWDWKTYSIEDLAVGSIRFENGAVLHIESSFAAHHEHDGTMDFQIMGTKGGAKWEKTTIFTDQNGYMVDITPSYLPPLPGNNFGGYFDLKLRNFIDHLVKGTPSNAPAEHGLMVQQMLDGIYQSAEKGGKEVPIK